MVGTTNLRKRKREEDDYGGEMKKNLIQGSELVGLRAEKKRTTGVD